MGVLGGWVFPYERGTPVALCPGTYGAPGGAGVLMSEASLYVAELGPARNSMMAMFFNSLP